MFILLKEFVFDDLVQNFVAIQSKLIFRKVTIFAEDNKTIIELGKES